MYSEEQQFDKLVDQLAKCACLMRDMPASEKRAEANAARDVFIKIGTDSKTPAVKPPGSQTIPRLLGKPLSGALLGALAGGAGGYALEQLRPGEEDEERQPWRRALTGALAGGAIGGGLGAVSEFKPTWFGGTDEAADRAAEARAKVLAAAGDKDPVAPLLESGGNILGQVGSNPSVQGALGGGLLAGGGYAALGVNARRLPKVDMHMATEAARKAIAAGPGKAVLGDAAADAVMTNPNMMKNMLAAAAKNESYSISVKTMVVDAVTGKSKPQYNNVIVSAEKVGDLMESGARVMREHTGATKSPFLMGGSATPRFVRRLFSSRPLTKTTMPSSRMSVKGGLRGLAMLALPFLGARVWGGLQSGKSQKRHAKGMKDYGAAIDAGR